MILITGGTAGIGLATASNLLARGHKVVIAGRDLTSADAALHQLPGACFLRADVSREADCRALVEATLEISRGRLRGLVNNAGIGERHRFAETTTADWERIMNTNARSAFLMTRLALPALMEGRGSVVNVASVAGLRGEENLALYTASKAAMIGLTQSLALELGHAVRFNAVCPGQVATRMMQKVLADPDRCTALEARIPVGRFAQPEDVGRTITWLLSDEAAYINGTVIPVDGGETAGLRALHNSTRPSYP